MSGYANGIGPFGGQLCPDYERHEAPKIVNFVRFRTWPLPLLSWVLGGLLVVVRGVPGRAVKPCGPFLGRACLRLYEALEVSLSQLVPPGGEALGRLNSIVVIVE